MLIIEVSKIRVFSKSQNSKLIIFWISVHELFDDETGKHGQSFRNALSMVNRLLFPSIQLVNMSILFNKSNEMGLDL